jgi:hypothetical protein
VQPELREEVDLGFDDWVAANAATQGSPVAPPTPASETPAPPTAGPFAAYQQSLTPPRRAARSDSGRWLDLHLLTVLATAGALPALRLPTTWLVVCATFAVVAAGTTIAHGRSIKHGTADVIVVPARIAGRLALGCLNPLNWMKLFLGALASLTAGAVAAALIGAGRWFVNEGFDGVLAAARTGAWSHAARYGAAFACYLLLSGVGNTHDRRAAALHRVTRKLREVALVGITVVLVAASALFAVAGPGTDAGFARSDDALGWVPPGLRTVFDEARTEVVHAELDAAAACLSGHARRLWTATYTAGNRAGNPDVATLTADPAQAPDQRALAAAALAAHNDLAPWVEVIKITIGGDVALVVDRHGLPTDTPLTDAAQLRSHVFGAPEWLATVAPAVDTGTVLDCSARTPL